MDVADPRGNRNQPRAPRQREDHLSRYLVRGDLQQCPLSALAPHPIAASHVNQFIIRCGYLNLVEAVTPCLIVDCHCTACRRICRVYWRWYAVDDGSMLCTVGEARQL